MPAPPATGRTLLDVRRDAATAHVLTAVRRRVIDHGLDATMEELATASGVSRRTLFRMFGSRERLVAAAFAQGMAGYLDGMPALAAGPGRDVAGWLTATCLAVHERNSVLGPGFWELTARTDLPPELAETERTRRRALRAFTRRVTEALWRASDGVGSPPEQLSLAVSAHLSPHFTAALTTDAGASWRVAARLAEDAVRSALDRALATGD